MKDKVSEALRDSFHNRRNQVIGSVFNAFERSFKPIIKRRKRKEERLSMEPVDQSVIKIRS